MLMSFLKRIDKLHKENRSVYGIEMSNNDFSSFINVEPVDISLTQKFIIRKQEKAKLLLVSGKQRVYLSDNDIISTILDMEKNCIDWFLNSFIKLYNDEFEVFNFKLEDKLYKGIGISYYQSQREISLFSDTKIDINPFFPEYTPGSYTISALPPNSILIPRSGDISYKALISVTTSTAQ